MADCKFDAVDISIAAGLGYTYAKNGLIGVFCALGVIFVVLLIVSFFQRRFPRG